MLKYSECFPVFYVLFYFRRRANGEETISKKESFKSVRQRTSSSSSSSSSSSKSLGTPVLDPPVPTLAGRAPPAGAWLPEGAWPPEAPPPPGPDLFVRHAAARRRHLPQGGAVQLAGDRQPGEPLELTGGGGGGVNQNFIDNKHVKRKD